MATSPVYGPNYGFAMWNTVAKGSRRGVVRLGQEMMGTTFATQNFSFRFASETQLPYFMARRIAVTASKIMYAIAQLYVEGNSKAYPPLTIEGAKLQHGAGNSVRSQLAGKSYLSGTEAAHFGIGTVTRQGEALSMHAARQTMIWRATSGLPADHPQASFESSGLLAGYGLAHDAATYLAPAFINQAEGLLERIKQPLMIGLVPTVQTHKPEQLESLLRSTGIHVAEFLATDPAAVISPIELRLSQLNQIADQKEFLQNPQDLANLLFEGVERNFLEAMRNQIKDLSSEFHKQLESVLRDAPRQALGLTELAVESRAERLAATEPR